MKTDVELLQRWEQFQDQTAFTELVRRYGGLVMATAVRRCGQRKHLADEVSQRVFAALARKSGKLISTPSLSAWLHRSTVLECAHLARREAIYSKKLSSLAHQSQIMHALPKTTASDIDTDLLDALDAALLRLRDRDREILMLRHVQGLSYRAIASILGINEGATQRQGSRALESLATRLKSRYATLTGVAVGAQLSHGFSLCATRVGVDALSALAQKQAVASGSTGIVRLWLSGFSRTKSWLTAAAVLTVIGVGLYLHLRSTPPAESLGNPSSLGEVTAQKGSSSGNTLIASETASPDNGPPLSTEVRERLLQVERLMMVKAMKQVSQVHQALFAYASRNDQKFPNPKDRNANAALRELFRVGLVDDESMFCMPGSPCTTDHDIGSKADDFVNALGPNENSLSYVMGYTTDRDDATLPILRADYVGKSGIHYVILARIGGSVQVSETTDGVVLDKRSGVDYDIFSRAYGTAPENILSPVMTNIVADEAWEDFLNLAIRDPHLARERCLQPQEGKETAPWLFNAANLAFGNISLEQFESSFQKILALPNGRHQTILLHALGSNFASYYDANRQTWPEVDRQFEALRKIHGVRNDDDSAIIASRLKQESVAQTAVWLESLPPDRISDLIRTVVPKFAAEDPIAAADWYVKISNAQRCSASQSERILQQAMTFWEDKAGSGEPDWAAASEWLLQQDQEYADQAKGMLARRWLQIGEPVVAAQWADSIRNPQYRENVVRALEVQARAAKPKSMPK